MIKRLAAILCVFSMVLSLSAMGESAYRCELGGKNVFEVSYHENEWMLMKGKEAEEEYTWLFTLYNDEYYIQCAMEYMEDYKDLSLYLSDTLTIAEYVEATCKAYEEYGCEFKNMHMIQVSRDGKTASLPFLEYRMKDAEYGESVFMETVSHGWSIMFEIFDADSQNPGNQDVKCGMLLKLLDGFSPM